jgi:hypothetical protein
MSAQKFVSLVVLFVLLALSLAACGTEPISIGEIPIYPGAELMERGQNEMADEMADVIRESSGGEGIAAEVNLYSLPAGTAWGDVKAFYQGELADTDWDPEGDLNEETDFFSSLGWSRGGATNEQALIAGYVGDMLGSGAFLIIGLFSE